MSALRLVLGLLTAAGVFQLRTPPQLAQRSAQPAVAKSAVTEQGLVTLRVQPSGMVRLPAMRLRLGSARTELYDLLRSCGAYRLRCEELLGAEQDGPLVIVKSFWLDRLEVSVADYERCVDRGRCSSAPFEPMPARYRQGALPMTFVTALEAEAYCAERGARLPTEAEFERAARGVRGRRYPWGNQFHGGLANFGRFGWARGNDRDGWLELAPVGSFPSGATPERVLDLAGNVAEWTSDRYAPYALGALAQVTSGERSVRGGHWAAPPVELRGAARIGVDASARAPFLGFRCARSAASAEPRSAGPTRR